MKKNDSGFTLIEIMVVIVVLGMLAGLAVPVFNGRVEHAKLKTDLANVSLIERTEGFYLFEHGQHSFDENIEQTAANFGDSLNNLAEYFKTGVTFHALTNIRWEKSGNAWSVAYDGIDTGQDEDDDEDGEDDENDEDGDEDEEPGGDGGDDDEDLPDYPFWSPEVAYYDYGTYVLHLGRVFWARQYVSQNKEPGLITNPWQEITDEYRNFNVYDPGAEVTHEGARFKARAFIDKNETPGLTTSDWQELTDEYRNFNVYDPGAEVTHEGARFKARAFIDKNETPGLFNSDWQEITDEWRSFNIYNWHDIVWYEGKQYQAKQWVHDERPPKTSPLWQLYES